MASTSLKRTAVRGHADLDPELGEPRPLTIGRGVLAGRSILIEHAQARTDLFETDRGDAGIHKARDALHGPSARLLRLVEGEAAIA
ncbi:MAG: hypothetical protein ABL879_17780 [Devosia sp.]